MLAQPGKLAFQVPANWPDGTVEVDVHDGEEWQLTDSWQHQQQASRRLLRRPAGAHRWRLRLWARDDEAVLERSGTTVVTAGATAVAPLH